MYPTSWYQFIHTSDKHMSRKKSMNLNTLHLYVIYISVIFLEFFLYGKLFTNNRNQILWTIQWLSFDLLKLHTPNVILQTDEKFVKFWHSLLYKKFYDRAIIVEKIGILYSWHCHRGQVCKNRPWSATHSLNLKRFECDWNMDGLCSLNKIL